MNKFLERYKRSTMRDTKNIYRWIKERKEFAVCEEKKYLQKLFKEASTYTAEITAIEMAMKIVQEDD